MMEKIRIDKWLWSVRIFKTRTLSANECKGGSIKLNERRAKPSSQICKDDILMVSKNGFNLEFKVRKLIAKRVSATLAAECYDDLTSDAELNKYKDWYVGKGKSESRNQGTGRPTKKDRRELDEFKDTIEYDFD